MAKLGGVTGRSQRNYESGARLPDAAYLAAIGIRPGVDLQFVLTGLRYEAEIGSRHALLVVLGERLHIDLDLVEAVISEAENYQISHMAPGNSVESEEHRRTFQNFADRLICAARVGEVAGHTGINQDILVEVMEALEQATASGRITARKKAQAAVMIYLASQAIGKIDAEFVKSAIRLAS